MVTFDSNSFNSNTVGTVTTISSTHVVADKPDQVLYAGFCVDDGSGTDYNPSATYGGVAMTRIANVIGAGAQSMSVFRMIAPPVGSATLTINWATAAQFLGLLGQNYYGVNQTTPNGTVVTINTAGTAISQAVTSAVGGMVLDFAANNNVSSLTPGGSQTSRKVLNIGAPSGLMFGTSDQVGAASVTMAWSWDASSQRRSFAGIPINNAPAHPPAPRSQRRFARFNNLFLPSAGLMLGTAAQGARLQRAA